MVLTTRPLMYWFHVTHRAVPCAVPCAVQMDAPEQRPNFGWHVQPAAEDVYSSHQVVEVPFGVAWLPPVVFLPVDSGGTPWERPDSPLVPLARLSLKCTGGLTYK